MNQNLSTENYFHLSGVSLEIGSVILPGNWGRVIRAAKWQHNLAIREMALEDSRIRKYPDRPSRLDSSFVFLSDGEARRFRQLINGFSHHVLYRVSLMVPGCLKHITDSRLCGPQGDLRDNWADVYWMEYDQQPKSLPGIDWAPNITEQNRLREMLTLSPLKIEERLN